MDYIIDSNTYLDKSDFWASATIYPPNNFWYPKTQSDTAFRSA